MYKHTPKTPIFGLQFCFRTQNISKMVDHWVLPIPAKIESRNVLRRVAEAHRYLAELKGLANNMPNQEILIDTLGLQEARESSAIENIISTFSDIYQSDVENNSFISPAAKEVHDYAN